MTPEGRRLLLAPDSFKGTFDAVVVARAWADALADVPGVVPETHPLSDGGDGFLAVLLHHEPDLLESRLRARDPLGRAVSARWAWDPAGDAAYLESAEVVGLARLDPAERDPRAALSSGLGPLLLGAAGMGAVRIVVGLGGSATVDAGLGLGRSLGYRFQAADGSPIERPDALAELDRIVPPGIDRLVGVEVVALADVDAPLTGPRGAAATFGPQKGADPEAVARLEAGLARAAERWVADLGAPEGLADAPGAGAAGGLGAALVALAGARLEPGAEWVAERTGFVAALEGAAGVIVGEGRYDAQSGGEKATGRALAAASRAGVPAAVVAGEIASEAPLPPGVVALDARDLGGGLRELPLEGLARLVALAAERLVGAPGRGPRPGGPS